MESARSKVAPLPNCSWCCGDLSLVDLQAGPQVMCVHCGRAPPQARSQTHPERRTMSLSATGQISGGARAVAG